MSKSNHHSTNKKPHLYKANYSTRTPYTLPQTKNPTNVGLQVFQYLEQSSVLAKYRFDINSLLNKGMSLKL